MAVGVETGIGWTAHRQWVVRELVGYERQKGRAVRPGGLRRKRHDTVGIGSPSRCEEAKSVREAVRIRLY